MTVLLDVNVLVALAWPNHVHHEPAHGWFSRLRGKRSWATCPVTQSGFVRVSANPATTSEARSPAECLDVLRQIVGLPGHIFWPDDISLVADLAVQPDAILGHRQVTDAHLLSLAVRRGGRLATFARGVLDLTRGLDPAAVEILD